MITIRQISEVFDAINEQTGRLAITTLLANLFKAATPDEAKIISYVSLGMLRAPYEGTAFGLAEKNVIKVLAAMFSLSQEEVQHRAHRLGDLGLVAAEGSWQAAHELSLVQVYDSLCTLEQTTGPGSQEEKRNTTNVPA